MKKVENKGQPNTNSNLIAHFSKSPSHLARGKPKERILKSRTLMSPVEKHVSRLATKTRLKESTLGRTETSVSG
jgi:hypothetical protein